MFDLLGYALIALGIVFLLLSAVGLIRMPDTITRMHTGTKASTLGSLLIMGGVMCIEPTMIPKLTLLALFILLTNPLSSSILARSTYLKHGFLNQSGMDDLKKEEIKALAHEETALEEASIEEVATEEISIKKEPS